MNEQDLTEDLRIIERAFDRTAYQESVDRATRNLSVDVLARMHARRRFTAWKVAAVLAPVATAVVVFIAPWKTSTPVVHPMATASVATTTPAERVQPRAHVSQVLQVNAKHVSHRSASPAPVSITEERLLTNVYQEQLVAGLTESVQDDPPMMFELSSKDLHVLTMSVNNEDAF